MAGTTPVDQNAFRRILFRNIALPLSMGVISAAVFVGLIVYLLSVMNWVEHTEQVIASANETARLSVDMESGMRGFLLTRDEHFLATYEVSGPRFRTELANLAELVADNQVQVERVKRIAALQAQWQETAQGIIELRRKDQDYLTPVAAGRSKNVFDELRNEFNALLALEERLRKERSDEAKHATYLTVGAFLFFSLSVSVILALFGRRDLMGLSSAFNLTLQKQADHALVLQQQAWLRAGQAELAESISGQLALPQIGAKTLDFIAAYLELPLAAFYTREGDGWLRRVASYGILAEQEKSSPAFYGSEGLLGQVAKNNRLLQLEKVPADYLKVSSALGESLPRHVVLVPISNEGVVNGVIELGFMRDISARDLEFLQLVAATLGTSVEAANYRLRLQDILAETQQLNEELQVQQEELRTANEELEEQSRVLEESQVNLENQKAELEQTNEQLAEQALQLDQKNAALNKAQVELEDRADELQRASRYKSEFLANMSHELRTPLNSSLILAKLLGDNPKGNLTDEQVRFAQTIYSAGNDLLVLINDILDISKVEAGKLELNPENIPLARLAESVESQFAAQAAQKGLQFKVTLAQDAPAHLVSDQQRIEQILKNLMSNALKFTDSGEVSLQITGQADGIHFAVQDSGIGIAPEQHDVIFEAFRQADGTTSRRYGGTGLGLSISRDLATLLGGAIQIASTPGKGSLFTLVLPELWREDQAVQAPAGRAPDPAAIMNAAVAAAAAAPAAATPARVVPRFPDDRERKANGERTVLVIEDAPDFAAILFDVAKEMQFRCLVSHSAAEGLQMAQDYTPDAILLDMRLPDGNGLSVLQALKENPATRHIPVHIVSAADRSDAALHLGAIGYALKPTTRDELVAVFHKLEEKFTQKVKRILLVEDDARQRDSVVQLIGDEDVEITAVALGEEALEQLRKNVFDCMIIDLKLPDIQGNELLKRMASEEICSFPPVIVYTGRNLSREEEADLLKYSRSIIIKGARSPERLVDEVTLFLHKVESNLSAEAQTMLKTVRSRDRIFEGRRVLLVDDDVRNIFALTSALEQKGLAIEVARNGVEAISKLQGTPDIDLVLMDVMMPVMDGLEATRRIRLDARFQKLPIIAITAKAMKDDQEQCMRAGATDYLAKPIDLDRLYSLLRVWMPPVERYAD